MGSETPTKIAPADGLQVPDIKGRIDPGKRQQQGLKLTSAKPSVAVFDMGGVLIDWDPRHLYRQLISDPSEMERFLAEVTTREWHQVQDHGGAGDPAPAGPPSRQARPDRGLLRPVRRDVRGGHPGN